MAKITRLTPVLQPEDYLLASLYPVFDGKDLLSTDEYKAEKEMYSRQAVDKLQAEKEQIPAFDSNAAMLIQHLKERASLELPFAKKVVRSDKSFEKGYRFFMTKAHHWAKELVGGRSLYNQMVPPPADIRVMYSWIDEYYMTDQAEEPAAPVKKTKSSGTDKTPAKKAGKKGGKKAGKKAEANAVPVKTGSPADDLGLKTAEEAVGLPWDDEPTAPAAKADDLADGPEETAPEDDASMSSASEGSAVPADPDVDGSSPFVQNKKKNGEIDGQLSFNFF